MYGLVPLEPAVDLGQADEREAGAGLDDAEIPEHVTAEARPHTRSKPQRSRTRSRAPDTNRLPEPTTNGFALRFTTPNTTTAGEIIMGQQLARTAQEIYKTRIEATPEYARLRKDGALGFDDYAKLTSAMIGALREALLFVAELVDDPDLLGDALLDSLCGEVATEPAD